MFRFNIYDGHCVIGSRGGLGAAEKVKISSPFWDLNHIPSSSSLGPDHFTDWAILTAIIILNLLFEALGIDLCYSFISTCVTVTLLYIFD